MNRELAGVIIQSRHRISPAAGKRINHETLRWEYLRLVLLLSPAAAGAQGLAPADAADFMGVWTVTLESPQGTFEQTLTLKDESGKVVAELTSQMQPEAQKVTDVSIVKGDLVLKYAGNFQGNPFDAAVTLTPDGADKAKVLFDINGGQFSMSGTGARTKK